MKSLDPKDRTLETLRPADIEGFHRSIAEELPNVLPVLVQISRHLRVIRDTIPPGLIALADQTTDSAIALTVKCQEHVQKKYPSAEWVALYDLQVDK